MLLTAVCAVVILFFPLPHPRLPTALLTPAAASGSSLIGLIIVVGVFSYLLGIFKMKYHGYPYRWEGLGQVERVGDGGRRMRRGQFDCFDR